MRKQEDSMSQDTEKIQNALIEFALSADSLLINGVTMGCLTPWEISRSFIKEREKKSVESLEELARLLSKHNLIPTAKGHVGKIAKILQDLTGFQKMDQDQVDFLLQAIIQEYQTLKEWIKSLEKSLQVDKPIYETRPVESAKRIDDFIHDLPNIFLAERNKQAQETAPLGIQTAKT
jgi:hypothetical protein